MAVPFQERTEGQEEGNWPLGGIAARRLHRRVIFALRDDEIWVLRIGHRREVYADRAFREPPADDSVSEP